MKTHGSVHGPPQASRVTAAVAGSGPLLGTDPAGRESLRAYRESGGYPRLPSPQAIRDAVRTAGLRGAGGAGFPTAVKLDAVAAAAGPRVAVANGEEGEPASAKDRWLMRNRPHLVIDGLRHAAHAVGSETTHLYVSDPAAAEALRNALAELRADPATAQVYGAGFSPTVVEVEPAYVAGEETAVVRAIGGDVAKPLPKPPRPYEKGVGGRPTLVSNVESLARVALAARAAPGTAGDGTVLLTVVDGARAWITEASSSAALRAVVERLRGGADGLAAVLLGGFAGGIWRPDMLDTTVSHDGMRARGALLGCGAVVLVGADDCPVGAAADAASYLAASSAGQCGACVRGTEISAAQLVAIARGAGTPEHLAVLRRRTAALPGRGNCALPDALAALLRTLVDNFADEIQAHMAAPCPVCADRVAPTSSADTRFRVRFPD
ncbi:NADH-ubiquinone oxidoreductase-F iron-sulfur binding region domain-containing protein [Yinghuangia seranimata]|uniref:NADH-ubiquinone oxidoreductase-F iron-sulfur binding region domain-containing protein n=1 Tax=Yinghuangia seranimata TaxID=408067 RepID=UPI00248CB0D1|nr:NADH-ubiquinone oxidoreductase-F iron-sulfur binding region domain-containing protein [Yinghuangia seranimata]MDI2132442.1 NADH-ubiquinone oxidoreductase-F iron-sulfur binding region domain-containing protein [Yinghuangia seranimata]